MNEVWYATADSRELVLVSSPGARHWHNLAVRPELAVVIFDSQQRPYTSEGVYTTVTGIRSSIEEST